MEKSQEFQRICEIYSSQEPSAACDNHTRKENHCLSVSCAIFEGLQANENILIQIERW